MYRCRVIASVIFTSLAVRIIVSFFRNIESKSPSGKRFLHIFTGVGYLEDDTGGKVAADYWLGFLIGVLETLSYAMLLASDNAAYAGAWLAFKTIHRWHYAPGVARGHFNRYLFGNAMVLVSAYAIARIMF